MPELGELLARVHSGDESWRTVQTRVREWRHQPRISQAFREAVEKRDARRGATATLFGSATARRPDVADESIAPAVSETTGRLWIDNGEPVFVRLEQDPPGRPSVLVRKGTVWWSYDETYKAMTNNGSPNYSTGGDEARSLLYPSRLLGRFRWRLDGEERIGDRRCLTAWAEDRELDEFLPPPFDMTLGGRNYRVWVDAERGVVLKVVKFVEGEQAELRELIDVVFDDVLPPSLFEFVPPEGAEIVHAGAAMHPRRRRSQRGSGLFSRAFRRS